MDILHKQLANVQKHLSWVQTEPMDWQLYVQGFSWAVALFESYLL
jgi:STE24 endopeptidase